MFGISPRRSEVEGNCPSVTVPIMPARWGPRAGWGMPGVHGATGQHVEADAISARDLAHDVCCFESPPHLGAVRRPDIITVIPVVESGGGAFSMCAFWRVGEKCERASVCVYDCCLLRQRKPELSMCPERRETNMMADPLLSIPPVSLSKHHPMPTFWKRSASARLSTES